ncbi:MAG TPA: hypothetical protein VM925_25385 [Labilithrix sp.]|nr:hypothetical protein [Labilithrix sp.]
MAAESPASLEAIWTEIDRVFVTAALGEVPARDAIERIRGVLAGTFGRCTIASGHDASGDEHAVELRIGNTADDSASTVILSRSEALDQRAVERLQRLFERLLEMAHPVPKGSKILHQLRNRLAGVQANIEFVEMVFSEAEGPVPEEREEIVKALGFAVRACREIATTLRTLGT